MELVPGQVWQQSCFLSVAGHPDGSRSCRGRQRTWQVSNRFQETPMSNKKGFTLIELLIVVVIIGILAAIAIPKFANTKDKAYVAAMKSDLRNMATYEEQYAADNGGAYFGGVATSAAPLQGFSPSQNVTVTVTNLAGPRRTRERETGLEPATPTLARLCATN